MMKRNFLKYLPHQLDTGVSSISPQILAQQRTIIFKGSVIPFLASPKKSIAVFRLKTIALIQSITKHDSKIVLTKVVAVVANFCKTNYWPVYC